MIQQPLPPIAKLLAYLLLSIAGTSLANAATLPCLTKDKLPATSGIVVNVATEAALQSAVGNLQPNTTILLAPGTYNLSNTLYIRKANISLRGDGTQCDKVILVGKGMDNANYGNVPHGVWSDALNLSVMNLTIKNVYFHSINLNAGAQSPKIESVQLLNSGEQFIKSNPTSYGIGVDNGSVKNSRFAYEAGTPTTDHGGGGVGYTNGVDVHAGDNWLISGNRFENFHTPDSSTSWWNPAILMWNGASGTIAENNVFVNVDRAIAYGLFERGEGADHRGGIIRNNMIYLTPGLFSAARKADSDAAILVWSSPGGTVVAHNTVLSNGNLNKSIEFRFDTTGAQALNNLVDIAIGSRGGVYSQQGNLTAATSALFVNPTDGDLHLKSTASAAIDKVSPVSAALIDFDSQARPGTGLVDAGADEYGAMSPPMPPTNPRGQQI